MPAVAQVLPEPLAGKLLCLIADCRRLLPLLQNLYERVGVPHRSTRNGIGSLVTRAEQPCGHPDRKVFALGETKEIRVAAILRECWGTRLGFHFVSVPAFVIYFFLS